MFVPITIYGQGNADTIIIIEPAPDSKNVLVTIEGELNNEGKVILYIKGIFGNSVGGYAQEYIFTENNPTHVFELDYSCSSNKISTALGPPNRTVLCAVDASCANAPGAKKVIPATAINQIAQRYIYFPLVDD